MNRFLLLLLYLDLTVIGKIEIKIHTTLHKECLRFVKALVAVSNHQGRCLFVDVPGLPH